MESCCTLCWDGCVTWLRCVFVGHVGYCWHGSIVSSSLVNVTYRKGDRSLHVLVAGWWHGVQALVRQRFRFLSWCFCVWYAVLDDKATIWFFHYIRCYHLCDVAVNDMVCTSALSAAWHETPDVGMVWAQTSICDWL